MDNNESTSEDDYNHDVPAFAEIDEHQLMAKDLLLIKRSLKMKLDSWALNTLDDAFFKINLKSHIYKMSSTEVDMTNFCRAVLYLMNGDYEISEHIISEIMEKYTSSVFFILKGIGLQQQSRYDEAQAQFTSALYKLKHVIGIKPLKSETWPDSDVPITSMDASVLISRIKFYLYANSVLKYLDHPYQNEDLERKDNSEEYMKAPKFNSKFTNNKSISKILKYGIFKYIQTRVDKLINFDIRNMSLECKNAFISEINNNLKPFSEITYGHLTVVNPENNVPQIPTSHENVKLIQCNKKTINKDLEISKSVIKLKESELQAAKDKLELMTNKLHELELKYQNAISKEKYLGDYNIELYAKVGELNFKLQQYEQNFVLSKNEWVKEIHELSSDISKLKIERQATNDATKSYIKNEQLYQNMILGLLKNLFKRRKHTSESYHTSCINNIDLLNSVKKYLSDITVPSIIDYYEHLWKWENNLNMSLALKNSFEFQCEEIQNMFFQRDLQGLLQLSELPDICLVATSFADKYFPLVMQQISEINMQVETCKKILTPEKPLQHNSFANNIGSDSMYSQGNLVPNTSTNNAIKSQDSFIQELFSDKNNISDKLSYNYKGNGACSSNPNTSTPSTSSFKLNADKENRKNVDSLCIFLKSQLPTRTEEEIWKALQTYRAQNKDMLSGKTIQNILTNVKKMLENPNEVWSIKDVKMWNSDNESMCCICFDPYNVAALLVLKCKHQFHEKCINKWLFCNNVCPICRKLVALDNSFNTSN